MVREYDKMKEEIKSSGTSVVYTIEIWLISAEKRMKEMVQEQ